MGHMPRKETEMMSRDEAEQVLAEKSVKQNVMVGDIIGVQVAKGEWRPAIVVKVWSQETMMVTANIFLDAPNDVPYRNHDDSPSITSYTSILPGDEVGQWNWLAQVV